MNNAEQYTVAIHAYNNVDTSFNIYYATPTVVANGIAIVDLAHDVSNVDDSQITFSYQSDLYNASAFLINVFDVTLNKHDDVIIHADDHSVDAGGGVRNYTLALNSGTTGLANIQKSDSLSVLVHAINENGVSLKSNHILI